MATKSKLEKAAKQWLSARKVIAEFIKELDFKTSPDQRERLAAALIARLAKEGLLICEADELKE